MQDDKNVSQRARIYIVLLCTRDIFKDQIDATKAFRYETLPC